MPPLYTNTSHRHSSVTPLALSPNSDRLTPFLSSPRQSTFTAQQNECEALLDNARGTCKATSIIASMVTVSQHERYSIQRDREGKCGVLRKPTRVESGFFVGRKTKIMHKHKIFEKKRVLDTQRLECFFSSFNNLPSVLACIALQNAAQDPTKGQEALKGQEAPTGARARGGQAAATAAARRRTACSFLVFVDQPDPIAGRLYSFRRR